MSFTWPDHYQMAVCLTWDVDGESAPYARMPKQATKQLSELHQRRYGPTIGMEKILAMLKRYDLKGTFYIPGYIAGLYKEMTQAIVDQGHALGLHGYLHESMDVLDQKEEEEILLKSIKVFERLLGKAPQIYRSPSWELNRWTPDLLVKHGILSDSSLMDDEKPYVLQTESGSIIEVPIQWLLDDAEYWMHTRNSREKPIADPETVLRIWSKEFEGYYQSGGCFVLTLHPFISGRWVYMDVVERFIRYMKGFTSIWWATVEELTQYCLEQHQQGKLTVKEPSPPQPYDI